MEIKSPAGFSIILVVLYLFVSKSDGSSAPLSSNAECPVSLYVEKHVCEGCWNEKQAIYFAKTSNDYRKRKACIVHVFNGYKSPNNYYTKDNQCKLLTGYVDGWVCTDVLHNTRCTRVKNCLPSHSTRENLYGHLLNVGTLCNEYPTQTLTLTSMMQMSECVKRCHAATATSRALCRVGSAVVAATACLATAWFTLGFSCVGTIGAASTFSEGCSLVIDFADPGCEDLCTLIVRKNVGASITDYNKLLHDHICVLKEDSKNYRWLDAVEFQGRVVEEEKAIFDELDAKKDKTLVKQLGRIIKSTGSFSDLFTQLKEHRERYNRLMFSEEGLLVINGQSKYFKWKALHGAQKLRIAINVLYQHISGERIWSIYKKDNQSNCNLKTFNLTNSYLVEAHMMLFTALEIDNKIGDVKGLTRILDGHQAEYTRSCGCPAGTNLQHVRADIQPLIQGLTGMVDIFSAPDLLLSVIGFAQQRDRDDADFPIIVKALAGAIQVNPGDKASVIRKLTTMKTQIEEKSLKVCTFHEFARCASHSHCIRFVHKCWCYVKDGIEQREACGYAKGYQKTYYSIVNTGRPRDLIIRMGLKPHPTNCKSNDDCHADCANNFCTSDGCWGSDSTCWTESARWARAITYGGIVRCRNYEL